MARMIFRLPAVGRFERVTFTLDAPGSTPADVVGLAGTALPSGGLRADPNGGLPTVKGPNGVSTLYLQTQAGAVALTGADEVPAAPSETTSGQVSAQVSAAVAALVNSAPGTLDTLGELATALAADESAAAALTTAVGQRLIAVDHGSTAGTARPTSVLPVKWFGTVAPTNAATNDEWYDRSTDQLKRWDGTTWVVAGSGTSVPLQASAHIAGSPIAGGYQTVTVLHSDDASNQLNIVCGTLPPWVYAAAHNFQIEIDAPEFSAGTLGISYAELNVSNADGSERMALCANPSVLTSGQQVVPLALDGGQAVAGAGTDLVANPNMITTTAGGCYVVSFFVQFSPSGLVA